MSHCMYGTCERWFGSYHARTQHMEALGHSMPDFEEGHAFHECRVCDTEFYSQQERDQHEVDSCYYCAACDRVFTSSNSLHMHMTSRVHSGTNMRCPFCGTDFATATGVCHHLERGSCPAARGLNRDEVYRVVCRKDPTGILSKKLIGWHGSPTYEATSNAWNGSGYECYLCSRTFNSLAGLNQHLGSPAHQQNLYHCPNRSRCGKEFKSLGGVMNHLESESCGFMRFDAVQKQVTNLVSGDRRIGF